MGGWDPCLHSWRYWSWWLGSPSRLSYVVPSGQPHPAQTLASPGWLWEKGDLRWQYTAHKAISKST